jgi:hypothetical protein
MMMVMMMMIIMTMLLLLIMMTMMMTGQVPGDVQGVRAEAGGQHQGADRREPHGPPGGRAHHGPLRQQD